MLKLGQWAHKNEVLRLHLGIFLFGWKNLIAEFLENSVMLVEMYCFSGLWVFSEDLHAENSRFYGKSFWKI